MEKVSKNSFYWPVLITVSAALVLSGCRTVRRIFVPAEPVNAEVVARFWDGPRIGPGMNLIIEIGSVTTQPVKMNVIVDQKGEITLQHLLEKPVPCDGLTLEALKEKLLKEYQIYYRQPQITVNFGPYDGHGVSPWGTVTVMGEVGTPGPVNMPPTMDLTVTKVLQLAGGVKPYADQTSIRVTRCDRQGNQTVTNVDLDEIGAEGRFDKDMVLKAGDVIFVPQTWY